MYVNLFGCEGEETTTYLSWGETGESELIQITPNNYSFHDDEIGDVVITDEDSKIIHVDINIKNISNEEIYVEEEFFESFGMINIDTKDIVSIGFNPYLNQEIISIEKGESTNIGVSFLVEDVESFSLVYGEDNPLRENYIIRWNELKN